MKVFAIADLHLPFSRPEKTMEVFGGRWVGYTQKLEKAWRKNIAAEDLVLLVGDISWAMKTDEAKADLDWIAALPGTKVMIKGNHDFWWDSISKMRRILPPSIHAIQNDLFTFHGIEVTGTRLWDCEEFSYEPFIEFVTPPAGIVMKGENKAEGAKIFEKELQRLERALKLFTPSAKKKICLVHYPPIAPDLSPTRASRLIENAKVDYCLFGHLHQVRPGSLPMGVSGGVKYCFVAGDYLDFDPLFLFSM